ncbi:MAG: type II secretion system protein [Candidatus Riflebacteria bacterium]|nr:type II secretion system protein [Candidatus Riflebacteria bacterium]
MKKGFTVVEVMISTLVLSILIGGIMFLFQRSNSAFSITLWKQERTKQAEVFWTHFRKYIEEASDLLEIPDDQLGKPHPEVKKKEAKPILVHSSPNLESKGKILGWNVSHLEFDFSNTGAHSSKSECYFLVKDGRKISLTGSRSSKPIAVLDDIQDINFVAKPLVKLEERSYTSLGNSDNLLPDDMVGTLLEISLTMTPPEHYVGEGNRIPHNHKFKLNVAFSKTTSINY